METVDRLEVFCAGKHVGTIAPYQKYLSAFAYSEEWLQSGFSQNPSAGLFVPDGTYLAADKTWYYSQSKKAVLVKYPNPKKDITLTVSFEDFDLIGM